MPCGVPERTLCAAPCAPTTAPAPTTTPEPITGISQIDPQCRNLELNAEGTSQRIALYHDVNKQLCSSFGFCRFGKYYEDDCIPGQYFDIAHGKL